MQPAPLSHQKPPRFQWFSIGVGLCLALCWGFIWAYRSPGKPGEKPIEFSSLLIAIAVVLGFGALWQYVRYRTFKQEVATGTLTAGSGPSSVFWAIIKAFFTPPTVHTGSRGGKYTIDYKGNKKYKRR